MADKTHNTDSSSSKVQVPRKASNSLFLTVSSPIEVNSNILVLVPEISRTLRDTPPAHHTLKIESFSQLSSLLRDDKIDKYESHDFEAGGYRWFVINFFLMGYVIRTYTGRNICIGI